VDSHRFDAIVRSAATPATRRATLRLLAGGLLGGWLAQRGLTLARAAQPAREEFDCPPGVCVGVEGPPIGDFLATCEAQGLTDCGGVCVDIYSDNANCGGCGIGCGGSEACGGGTCLILAEPGLAVTCVAAGLTDCGGVCVDTLADVNNCGGCGVVCGPSDGCLGGSCVPPPERGCNNVTTNCGGVCVNLTNNAAHCGACFNSCPLGGVCQGGFCGGLVCPAGLTDCGVGYCIDLASDSYYCGGCEFACYGGATCQNGACV
jgi:hypothetical protein